MSELLASAIRLMTPVGYVALGETFAEQAGMLNVGLEGAMLIAALVAAAAAIWSGSVLVGFAAAAVVGILILAFAALMNLYFRADQIVVGVGINLVGLGLTTVLATQPGSALDVSPHLEEISIPVLSGIPVLGPALFEQNASVYALAAVTVAAAVVSLRTAWGLRVRAVGDTPAAADAGGVSVTSVRAQAMVVCGALTGLGGAALSIGALRGFTPDMTSGRGFIALAAVIFGRWRPTTVVAACLVFGLTDALRFQLPTWSWAPTIPPSFLFMLPYVVALVAMAALKGSSAAPSALTRTYERRR